MALASHALGFTEPTGRNTLTGIAGHYIKTIPSIYLVPTYHVLYIHNFIENSTLFLKSTPQLINNLGASDVIHVDL